jgi:ribonuclease D
MHEVHWIEDQADFGRAMATLATATELALDTEFLRERTYFPRLCLLQLSAGAATWLIDTIAVKDLTALATLLTRRDMRKIMHAGRQDLEVLRLATGAATAPIWDTQIASACLQARAQISYADLIETTLGIKLDKGQTRTDWSRRPLSEAQRRYAVDDVRYLGTLAAQLEQRLADKRRSDWVLEDCAALAQLPSIDSGPSEAWRRLSGLAQLPPRPRAMAKSLAAWRERVAIDLDRPRAWILTDAAIYALAARGEFDAALLRQHAGMHKPLDATRLASLTECLTDAARAPLADLAPALESRPSPEERQRLKRLAALVDQRAGELGISAEVLATRGELKSLLQGERELNLLRGWRRREIGDRLLGALNDACGAMRADAACE